MIPIRPSLIRFIRRRERLDGKAAVHRDVHHRRIVVGGRNDKAVIQGFGNSAAESVLGFFKSEFIHPSFFSPILPFENILDRFFFRAALILWERPASSLPPCDR